jgi:hypothetical protein
MNTEANLRLAQWQHAMLDRLSDTGMAGQIICNHQCEECEQECVGEEHKVDAEGCQPCYDERVDTILDPDV